MSTNFRSIQSSPDAEVSIVTATPVRPLNEKASSMVLHSSPTGGGGTLLSTTASSTPVRSRSPTFSSSQKFILHEPERLAAGTTPRQQQRSAFGASSSEATSDIGRPHVTTNGINNNNTPDWRMFHSDETRHRGAPSSVEDISKDNSTMYSSSNIYATIPKIISATSVNNPGNTKVLLSEATGPPPRPPHPDDIVDPHFQLRFRDLPTQVQQQKIYEWKMSYLSHRARKRNQQQQHHQQQQQPMVVPPSSSDSNHILFGHSVAGSRTTTIPTASPQVRSTSPFARTTSATTTSNQRFPSPHRSDTATKSGPPLSGPVNRSQVPTTETLNSFLYTGVQPTTTLGGQSAFSRSSTTTSVPQQPRQSSGSPAANTRCTAPRNGGTLKNVSTYQRSMTPTSSSPAQQQGGSGGRDVVAKSGYHRSFTPPISKSQVPWVHRKY
eukprot:PhF_6_TR42104/c0_g2_i2/m.63568